MPHSIILFDNDGNEIGLYYPPHDPDTGGGAPTKPSVDIDTAKAAAAIHEAVGIKDAEGSGYTSIRVQFHAEKA